MIARGLLSLLPFFMVACTGYHLGSSRPAPLRHVSIIHLELVESKSQMPRAAAYATNALADAFTRDGTYRLGTTSNADAKLSTTLRSIDYDQVRSSRTDTLLSEELEMQVELHWSLSDANNPARILESGTSLGRTRFFVDPNLQTARQTAITDALKQASESLVARLADGF